MPFLLSSFFLQCWRVSFLLLLKFVFSPGPFFLMNNYFLCFCWIVINFVLVLGLFFDSSVHSPPIFLRFSYPFSMVERYSRCSSDFITAACRGYVLNLCYVHLSLFLFSISFVYFLDQFRIRKLGVFIYLWCNFDKEILRPRKLLYVLYVLYYIIWFICIFIIFLPIRPDQKIKCVWSQCNLYMNSGLHCNFSYRF